MSRASTRTLIEEGGGGGTVCRTVLPSGLRVITEALPTVRSVAVGVWVGIGSRDEAPAFAGASHYLEHLLFKGTERRSALEISSTVEAVGGETNAFTAKEYTCYYARVLDEDLPMAMDVLGDMVCSSLITAADLEIERGVILEEISMHDDDPGEVVHDLFADALFGDHALGRPVLGNTDTIGAMSRAQVHSFYRRRYTPDEMVVAVAGNLSHDVVVELVERSFTGNAPAEPKAERRGSAADVPHRTGHVEVHVKDTEQAHLVIGGKGLCRHDDRRFTLGVLNHALGGGMSSRLFQEIREKRGLAYSVYSFSSQFADTGQVGVYAGCAPGKADEVLQLVVDELRRVAEHGLTDDEVTRGKGMVKGSTVLGLEDTGSRMSRIGKGDLLYGEVMTMDEIIARIDAVTPDHIRSVASDLLGGPLTLGVIGPFDGHDFSEAVAR